MPTGNYHPGSCMSVLSVLHALMKKDVLWVDAVEDEVIIVGTVYQSFLFYIIVVFEVRIT